MRHFILATRFLSHLTAASQVRFDADFESGNKKARTTNSIKVIVTLGTRLSIFLSDT